MRIIKYSHSCVRLEGDGVLVIDPGVFSERAALDGADAVLITHEHPDHLDPEAVADAVARQPGLRVYVHTEVLPRTAAFADAVVTVEAGDEFTAAGFSVQAYGGIHSHAVIHPDIPQIANLGYLVDGAVYHPGDSFHAPEGAEVETLFVPLHAPWAKLSESIDFVRRVAPRRAVAVHDALLTEAGAGIYDGHLQRLSGTTYAHVPAGTTLA